MAILHDLFSRQRSFEFDNPAAEAYGRLRHELEIKGQVIGSMDMLIAAIVLANDLVVVTHNRAEFGRIVDLQLAD